jgi:hypothetical protein
MRHEPSVRGLATEQVARINLHQATKSGGEDFSSPTYTVRHGATSFETPRLPATQQFYFVVRARDRAGNEDSNLVEREGVNLCV